MTDREVYEEIAPDLVRYATVLVGPDHAAGVVSAVVCRALRQSRGLVGLDTPRTYLMKAVLDEGVSWRRSHRPAHHSSAVDSSIPEVDVEVGNVDDMVTDLPPQHRVAAYLVISLTHSPSEAAELMGKRPGTIRRYLKLARRNLDALDDDRIKEVFKRIAANAPDAPAFAALDNGATDPGISIRNKTWIWVTGAAALVVVVAVLAFGLFGGDNPDLAAPDENTVDYVKLEYSGSAQAVCTGGEATDNFGHNEATIEIWGPNSDDLTLVVATFPDGSTERTVLEGSVENPVRGWGRDPTDYPDDTSLRVIGCETGESEVLPLLEGFSLPHRGPIPPSWFLSPPDGSGTWSDFFGDAIPAELDGTPVLLYELRRDNDDAVLEMDLYVTEDNDALLRQYTRATYHGVGSVVVEVQVVEKSQVPADSISFDTSGLVAFDYSRGFEFDREHCPVTITSQNFIPPDTHPPTPSGPDTVWFGKDELWTVLSTDGISDRRMSVWWSTDFTDPETESSPDITVTYTLIGSTSLTIVNDESTNASTPEDGLFIIAGSAPDIEGCWHVMATYKNASLSYIYYNPEGQDPATPTVTAVVPEVVGMTVDNARHAITGKGFKPFFFDSDDALYEVCAQDPADGSVMNLGSAVEMRTAPLGGCGDLMGVTDPNVCDRAPEFIEGPSVYFNCSDGTDSEPRPVQRGFVPDLPIETAVEQVFAEMLQGPTPAEREASYWSSFSEETAGALLSVTYHDETQALVLDFTEAVLVNNASTSTGSQFYLGELLANAFQFEEVRSVEFRVNGSCEAFWYFLQAGECNVIDRP